MKINKKIIVPFLSTVVGLSLAGGLGGAFAWYQFNSQVRTGFIGTSVADTGLIQIGYEDGGDIVWGRERFLPDTNLKPVTFGQLGADKSLGAKAYGYPEAGKQNGNDYTQGWQEIQPGQGYYQYDIYLRALKADANALGDPTNDINPGYKLVAQDVYLTEMTLEGVKGAADIDDALIADALRVHYAVNDGGANKKELISKTAITDAAPLNLYGELDLDADGNPDTYDVDNWDSRWGQHLTYGINGQTQVTKGISGVVETRQADGTIATSDKVICKTKTSGEMTKITITVWLEGWALLATDSSDLTAKSNIWNPNENAGVQVHVGMVFDVGRNILG